MLREVILEHALIAELLRHFWNHGIHDAEILRSEFDAGGYDLVLSRGGLTRHIQLKAAIAGAATQGVTLGLRLAARPSGCVIWMVVKEDLSIDHFLWFGNPPGQPLPDIAGLAVARHAKGNATGYKAARPNHRRVPRKAFARIVSIPELAERLIGPH